MWTILLTLAAITHIRPSDAKANCPLYGPLLPKPINLLQQPEIQAAAKALDAIFPKYIDNDKSTGSEHFSYSVEVFSASEDKPLWNHFWTAPNLASFNSTGVSKVDANTVYRLGSITKLYTVLTFLATVGDGIWNDPVTKYIPEFAAVAKQTHGGSMFVPDWDSITVGSLASQSSGLMRDYALLGEVTYQLKLSDLYAIGFPPISLYEIPPCGVNPTCTRKQLLSGISKLPPSFAPGTTPVYSDIGFTILSYIAEKITGKKFKSMVQDSVLTPLNLTHTFVSAPDDSLGIIPGNRYSTSWAFELAEEAATGNMYASAGDLSAFGRAVMRSSLLKPAMTRRWLKPSVFTSDPKGTIGMPWGIRQIDLSSSGASYQSVHAYNKLGSLGAYTSLLVIIPELDLGFSILAAGDPPPGLAMDIADTITSTYIPTIMTLARNQANATFSGVYKYTGNITVGGGGGGGNSSGTNATGPYPTNPPAAKTMNSTLTISVDASKPGLGVTNWISNGTDMAFISVAIGANITDDYFSKVKPSVRLYPTGAEEKTTGGGKRVAFKAVFEDLSLAEKKASFSSDCTSWVSVTAVVYGSKPLDMFIFDFDKDGKVTDVENAALRVKLDKVSSI
ncbi:beta-lactamase/transpeptidase-like protein [Podospora appendiculata]|uniref:Beta-lactamase/transpeptidase-like protein n=1 Tax=Podospora appendiculata TaxID=314037 RepID=A0AAE0X563_9PEZI|nr:beta-lactamase/transpeptidase-like protein [Podospora appendiculata]